MAVVYRAEIRPTKLELLNLWLPNRPWYRGDPAPRFDRVSSFRFDDPAGEVGVETMLVRAADGRLIQAPLTYRGAPLEGGEAWLLGTMEHSVLGQRWIYDATGDPVYVAAIVEAIAGRSGQAEEVLDDDGRREVRAPAMTVRGSGDATIAAVTSVFGVEESDGTLIRTDAADLYLVRRLDEPVDPAGAATLTGTWDGQATSAVLATATAPVRAA